MITEFNGFTEGVIGKKLPVDTTLNNMKKSELIELLHTAQHNYDTLMQFYTNAVNVNMDKWKEHDKEIRNKAIEEFLERELEVLEDFKYWEDDSGHPIHSISETQRISKCKELIKQIADQMKEVGE